MRSSISSFSLRVGVFVAVLAAATAVAELHCRYSPRFSGEGAFHIRRFMLADPTNAVFVDSQVGWGPLLPGFSFLATAAQQPPELVRLVHYFYAIRNPERIILQAAPQWFGQYHANRAELITDDALPFRYVNLLLSSSYFHRPLKENVFVHPTALVEAATIGDETRIWAFSHVMADARVGARCNIGDHCFIESGAWIGDDGTIKNGNMIWEGIRLEDGVFVGPRVFFCNDAYRAPRDCRSSGRATPTSGAGWSPPSSAPAPRWGRGRSSSPGSPSGNSPRWGPAPS